MNLLKSDDEEKVVNKKDRQEIEGKFLPFGGRVHSGLRRHCSGADLDKFKGVKPVRVDAVK